MSTGAFFFQMWQESQAKIYNKLGLAENGGMKKLIWMASISQGGKFFFAPSVENKTG